MMVHVIGAPGSGKSTVAALLGNALRLPVFSIDEERLDFIRPGDHWPWGRDHLAWTSLIAKYLQARHAVVETMGASEYEGKLEAAADAVIRVLVTAPDDVRQQRLADRVTDGYVFARQRDYVRKLLPMRPLLKADIETDGEDLTPVIAVCEARL